MRLPFKTEKERTLGKVRGKRRYDLPLDNNDSTRFLITLIGLMSFLSVLGLCAFFVLSDMTERWTSGLKGKMTIEITASGLDSEDSYNQEIERKTKAVISILSLHPSVESFHALSHEEIYQLIEPWMNKDALVAGQIPLPALITLEIKPRTDTQTINNLAEKLESLSEGIRLDTHDTWLKDILKFANGLRFAALALLIVIILTTITAIAGAVRSRLAIYKADVELLHLMGAADHYISRQFQRHALRLALAGSFMGVIAGIALAAGLSWASGNMGIHLLPDFKLQLWHYIALLGLPFILSALAAFTARHTVLRELLKLP